MWIEQVLKAEEVPATRQRVRAVPLKSYPAQTAARFDTRCTVSRRGHRSLAEANRAIAAATRDGTLARVIGRLR